MQVQLSPISAPSVKTATTGMAGAMLYDLKFSVQPSTGGLVPVFEFNSSIVLGLDVEVGASRQGAVCSFQADVCVCGFLRRKC